MTVPRVSSVKSSCGLSDVSIVTAGAKAFWLRLPHHIAPSRRSWQTAMRDDLACLTQKTFSLMLDLSGD
jgi:hypothetical protein